jgi:hypothetical protein
MSCTEIIPYPCADSFDDKNLIYIITVPKLLLYGRPLEFCTLDNH